ncbi:polygalacturonase [Tothia fuscella]|uniref:galacturonan 1,4-alpha-galacturonidase n=1 Tax=Tothia fuscella TaxID=1048955 RepID=A0A9P4NVP4_9PEZI|nr:polygalacturonase [Tothia fuscella]
MFPPFLPLLILSQLSLISAGGRVTTSYKNQIKQCTIISRGNKQDDSPNILKALQDCSPGGNVVLPEKEEYYLASKLHATVHNISIEWRGTLTMSDDITYWRNPANTFPIAFQNHATSFILSGSSITVTGYGTGGIDGNGDAWYNAEEAHTRPGRPMPFVLWNVTDVVVKDFFIKQPTLWAFNIMGGKDIVVDGLHVNASATKSPWGKNWVQNTDGFDTMDCHNVTLRNFVYQGGDDCIAIKPRSYNINVRNVTCRGGNGIAIGSLGQYLEESGVENVSISDVKIIRYNEDMHNSAYIKTWIGGQVPQDSYESGGQPRGGGWGRVHNISFSNFDIQGADSGPAITQDNGNNGSFSGTSRMEISDIKFENFSGHLNGKGRTSSINCSKVKPCSGIVFRDVKIRPEKDMEGYGTGRCVNVRPGAVVGLKGEGCS